MSQQNNTDNPASAATGSNDGVGTQQQTAQDDNTVKTQGQRQKRSNDVNTRDNESKENGSNDNPNEQTSNDEINKSNRSNKAEMKTENESQDSEFLVFVRSLRIPFEKEMIDELRDEEFDLVEMAKAQPPNHSGIVAFGKSIGFTGDKLGYFAEKLATKLVNKYGNTQSNGNGDRAGSRIETFNLRFQKKQKIVTEEVMYNHDDPSSINIVQALKIKYPNYSPYLDSDGDKSINHDKQFFDNKDSILHLVITKFSLASNVSPTQRKIATLNSLLTDDMRDRIKTNSDENDTTHMLESGGAGDDTGSDDDCPEFRKPICAMVTITFLQCIGYLAYKSGKSRWFVAAVAYYVFILFLNFFMLIAQAFSWAVVVAGMVGWFGIFIAVFQEDIALKFEKRKEIWTSVFKKTSFQQLVVYSYPLNVLDNDIGEMIEDYLKKSKGGFLFSLITSKVLKYGGAIEGQDDGEIFGSKACIGWTLSFIGAFWLQGGYFVFRIFYPPANE